MRSVEEQLEFIAEAAATPEPVRIAIAHSLGLQCAEDVVATTAQPSFAQAAIDGYAVRAVDVGGEVPLGAPGSAPEQDAAAAEAAGTTGASAAPALPVVGEVPAGSKQPLRLQPKQALRVYTGAPLPTLADAVLPLEWSDRGRKRVSAIRPVRSGDFVRRVGDDIQPGDIAVNAGTIITPAHIGLLAAAGRSKVLAYPRPRLAVMSFGRELVDIDNKPGLGQVYDVNSYALAAAAKEAGADITRVGIIEGEPRRLKETLETQLARSEILLLSGAVGGAGAEPVQEVLRELGAIDTTRVALHPGSVQGFGVLGPQRTPIFLLPANPVAALVIFEVFVRPLIRLALGKRGAHRRVVRARALNHIASQAGRRGYIRARLMRDAHTADYLVEGLGGATGAPAHLLAGLAGANALIRIPEDVTQVRPGDVVDVLFLNQHA